MTTAQIKVKADFSGGLDLVFDGQTEINLKVPEGTTVQKLIVLLTNQHANSKNRPGILVLINQVDWELADKQSCILEANDKVSFISTLHGG